LPTPQTTIILTIFPFSFSYQEPDPMKQLHLPSCPFMANCVLLFTPLLGSSICNVCISSLFCVNKMS
jgi:hypothetical protein